MSPEAARNLAIVNAYHEGRGAIEHIARREFWDGFWIGAAAGAGLVAFAAAIILTLGR